MIRHIVMWKFRPGTEQFTLTPGFGIDYPQRRFAIKYPFTDHLTVIRRPSGGFPAAGTTSNDFVFLGDNRYSMPL